MLRLNKIDPGSNDSLHLRVNFTSENDGGNEDISTDSPTPSRSMRLVPFYPIWWDLVETAEKRES